jgi:hypothetical protein
MRNKEIISYLCILLIGIFFIFPVFSNSSSSLLTNSKNSTEKSIRAKYKKFNPYLDNNTLITSDKNKLTAYTAEFNTGILSRELILFYILCIIPFAFLYFVNISLLKEKITLRLRI